MTRRQGALVWTVLLIAGGLYSLAIGQDMSGDQRNNHTYEMWLLFHHQQDIAWGVGGAAGYTAANWDIPWYLAAMHLPTPVTVFLLGVLHAVAAVLAVWIVWTLLSSAPRRARLAVSALAGAVSVWSPAYLAEFGTTYGNIVTAIPVLAAVLLVIRSRDHELSMRRALVVGLLIGAAFGLKLSNGPFVLALFAGLVAVGARSVAGLRAVIVAGVGMVVGTLLSGGPWFVAMARRFDNPLFPFYSGVFPSRYGPAANVRDERFAVHSWSDALTLPFRMALRSGYPSELRGRTAVWVVVVVLVLAVLVGRLVRGPVDAPWVRHRDRLFVLVFTVVGFVAWDVQFAVARYGLALELLAGAVLVCLADQVGSRTRARVAVCAVVALLAVPSVVIPRFFHQSPWHPRWYDARPPALARQHDLLVVFPTRDNASFLVSALPSDARAVQAPNIYPKDTYPPGQVGLEDVEVRRVIEEASGPVVSITALGRRGDASRVADDYGYRIPPSSCQTLTTSYHDFVVCPWERLPG